MGFWQIGGRAPRPGRCRATAHQTLKLVCMGQWSPTTYVGARALQKSLPLESPRTPVVQQPGQRCPFVVRALDPEAYPVEDKLLSVFNCRAIVAAFDVECVCFRVLFYCLDMHVLEGSTAYLLCNVAGLHFFHRDRSLSFNAPFLIAWLTMFISILFRVDEDRTRGNEVTYCLRWEPINSAVR